MSNTNIATEKETWAIDASHSQVEFSVKHMMITTVKGRFAGVEGQVTTSDDTGDEWLVDVRIDASSIDTRAEQRDEHLRSADFLDAENHPELTFRSKDIEGSFDEAGDEFRIIGDLTIRGTTKKVVLKVVYEGRGRDPWGGDRLSFSASTKIDRREFGLTWNQALEAGGVLVSNDVKIDLDIQLVKQS